MSDFVCTPWRWLSRRRLGARVVIIIVALGAAGAGISFVTGVSIEVVVAAEVAVVKSAIALDRYMRKIRRRGSPGIA